MTREEETTIVLCGGPINYTHLPIGTNISNAMVPINGKPVIGWILDDLLTKDIRNVVVILRQQDQRLQAFINRVYSGRMSLRNFPLAMGGTILQSLQAGLDVEPPTGLVRVVLGDTLIRDPYTGEGDFVYVGEVTDSRRWCLAVTDTSGRVVNYIDKQTVPTGPYKALAGYYHFCHGEFLEECVDETISQGERELSDLLRRYGKAYPVYARSAGEWYDFGHIDNLVDARRRLLSSRFFNSLTINPVLNTITKISNHSEKLADELHWYQNLPDELKVLNPRILSHQFINKRLQIVQEYYGYPTLAELYVYADLHEDTWISILRHVLQIHREFQRYPGKLDSSHIKSMYVDKTWRRLEDLQAQGSRWVDLLNRRKIIFNGQELQGIPELIEPINAKAQELAKKAPVFITHGDFCFSNILFDINNQIIRLIDPRGRFGLRGIYGDARYDIAKLRHSVCELYDFITADMFEFSETPNGFKGTIYTNGIPQGVGNALDQMIEDMGYDLTEIQFIEGLLFVSMLPLHHEKPQRQKMMYLTGLTLLNEVI